MKKFTFTNIPEFCECLSNTYCEVTEDDELNSVSVVAKYDDMREIVEELIYIGYEIRSIELHDPEVFNYKGEYLCTIYDDKIGVQKMKNEKGYLNPEASVTFVLNNCSHKVLDCIRSELKYEVEICEGNEETCDCACCKNDDKVTVKVNGKKVTDEKEKADTLAAYRNFSKAIDAIFDDFYYFW